MAFRHGKDTIALIGGYDLSNWLNTATATQNFDSVDTSHFGTQGKSYIPGIQDGAFALAGMFDTDKTALEDKIAAITADSTGMPIAIANDGGLTVGRRVSTGRLRRTGYEITSPVADVTAISVAGVSNGAISQGVVLLDATARSTTTTGASVDGAVATSRGLTAYAHIASNGNASNTIKVQHSTDNSVWVDLTTATALPVVSTTPNYVVLTATGTVNRYLRGVLTIVGGSATVPLTATRN